MTPLLLHCHLPKTAGSALNQLALLPRFESSEVLLAYGEPFERRRAYSTRLSGGSFVSGHVPFGYLSDQGRPVLHLSILRDPVERLVSFLNYVAMEPRHGLRRRFREDLHDLAEQDPERFSERLLGDDLVRQRQGDIMVRLISGLPRLSDTAPGEDDLARALVRVRERGYLLGVHEAFDDFVSRVTERLDEEGIGAWGRAAPKMSGALVKQLKRVVTLDALSKRSRKIAGRMTALDQRLYDAVAERLARRAA